MKLICYILPLLLLHNCRAQTTQVDSLKLNKDDNSLLWEISGNGLSKPGYLFGTFHLMCKEDMHFSKQLHTAIKNSAEVYFEMDLDDPTNTLGALFFINMKGGKSLTDLYTKEEYARLENFFKDSLGMSLSMFKRMKPNMLEAFMYPKMMACKSLSGLEEELMSIAKKDKKEIRGFETIEFQSSVFDSIPYESQAKELLKSIDSMATNKVYFNSMLKAYRSQQLSEIEGMFTKSEFGVEENREVLLDNRNKNWVAQLKKILPEKNVFIAVGAGHLVGEMGLISLLKKAGYTLQPLENTD